MDSEAELPETVLLATMAALLDVRPEYINELERGGVLEKTERGRYRLASIRIYLRQLRDRGAGSDSWNEARISLTREKARLAELERKEREGELIPLQEVIAVNTVVAARVRDRLLGIASRIAMRVAAARNAADAERIIYAAIVEALEELASLTVVGRSGPAPRRRRGGRAAEKI